MDGSDYWRHWAERRLSRRRLLARAAGVGAGLAAVSLVGCGGEKAAPSASPGASPGASPAAPPAGSPAATPQGNVFFRWGTGPRPELEPAGTRGGMQRWFGHGAASRRPWTSTSRATWMLQATRRSPRGGCRSGSL